MNLNFLSITFWFNIYDDYTDLLKDLSSELNDEFKNFNVLNEENDNLFTPVISGISENHQTNLAISKINLQYNMRNVNFEMIPLFKEKALKLFDILDNNDVDILHTEIYSSGEMLIDKALNYITKNTINKKIYNDDLIDVYLRLGKKHEDLFYKIISILNKKQVKLPKKVNENNISIPLPLISWHDAEIENEIIEISYEINDKYSFDFTKGYHTTVFHLNKMLYILENDIKSDVDNLIKKGEF